VGVVIVFRPNPTTHNLEQPQRQPVAVAEPAETTPPPTTIETFAPLLQSPASNTTAAAARAGPPLAPPNKADRLTQLRETFRALASGDPKIALRAAKLLNGTERETALLTLIAEWKQGELSPPRRRAKLIADFGLEAGLGAELADKPELAAMWAEELTDGQGRAFVLSQTALAMVGKDPEGAIALSRQFPMGDESLFHWVFARWADKDTDAALRYADQLSSPTEREAALNGIHSVAPVGIGAALTMQEGFPVITGLLAGTPAELSGQLHPGDCIVAVAQGSGSFVQTQGMPLSDVVKAIRGTPGTSVRLQVVASDASPDSVPLTVSIIRGQIKYKQ